MNRLKNIIKKYGRFLDEAGRYYREATEKQNVRCKKDCFECCASGFFDITLMDAIYLNASLKRLPAQIRRRLVARANEQLDTLEKKQAFSRNDPILYDQKAIDIVSRRSARVHCPALENGRCLVYEYRPHICRIFGPTIRGRRRAVHLEGCGYFRRDIPETDFPILSHYEDENRILLELFTSAGRKKIWEVDTIIPAALIISVGHWWEILKGSADGDYR